MDREPEASKTANRVLILLAVLFGLPLAAFFVPSLLGGNDEFTPGSGEDASYLLIDGKKHIARDKDRDGIVDCLVPIGTAMFTGRGVFYGEGFESRCSRLDSSARPMSDELREALSEMTRRKYIMQAANTNSIDLDADGVVDCVVSVHAPETVVFQAPGARCPSKGRETLTEEDVRRFSELLAIEERIRRHVR